MQLKANATVNQIEPSLVSYSCHLEEAIEPVTPTLGPVFLGGYY